MALSENMRKLHEAQDALAKECFEDYKQRIGRKFIKKYGGSYQRYEEIGDDWRKIYSYGVICEEYLKTRTITFLGTLPEDNSMYRNPRFLKNLIAKISEFLSTYISKKYEDPCKERNNCTRSLIKYFTEHHALKRVMENFQKQKEHEWGLKQKSRRAEQATHEQRKTRTRKHINKRYGDQKPVHSDQINKRNISERIRLKKLEIANFEIHIHAHVK